MVLKHILVRYIDLFVLTAIRLLINI